MVRTVDICNMALSSIGTRSTIASLTEGSAEAIQCSIWYDPTRREILAAAQWNFARRQKTLGVLAAAAGTPENPTGSGALPPDGWLYQYAYPSDCISPRYIQPAGDTGYDEIAMGSFAGRPIRFIVAGAFDSSGNEIKVILTNEPQAELIYTGDVSTTAIFESDFITALADALAARLAIPLTGDKQLAVQKAQASQGTLKETEAQDANVGPVVLDIEPDWIRDRGFAGTWRDNEQGESFVTYVTTGS